MFQLCLKFVSLKKKPNSPGFGVLVLEASGHVFINDSSIDEEIQLLELEVQKVQPNIENFSGSSSGDGKEMTQVFILPVESNFHHKQKELIVNGQLSALVFQMIGCWTQALKNDHEMLV